MNQNTLQSILTIGETAAVEFKRCGSGIESDTYKSVCSFLNRFGGDLFLDIQDDGTVTGVPQNAAMDMVKNFVKVVSNPALFSPPFIWSRKLSGTTGSVPLSMYTCLPALSGSQL